MSRVGSSLACKAGRPRFILLLTRCTGSLFVPYFLPRHFHSFVLVRLGTKSRLPPLSLSFPRLEGSIMFRFRNSPR